MLYFCSQRCFKIAADYLDPDHDILYAVVNRVLHCSPPMTDPSVPNALKPEHQRNAPDYAASQIFTQGRLFGQDSAIACKENPLSIVKTMMAKMLSNSNSSSKVSAASGVAV